ncbi:MAG: hypothetical protein J0H15_08295 [Xanthomonadales bacterium]|nr:hypothetical protein [Xanthomonadales bacterium]
MKRGSWVTMALALCSGAAWAGAGVWTSEGPYGGEAGKLLADPSTPGLLYAGTPGGIFRSNDGGVSWTRKMAGFNGALYLVDAFALDAEAPSTLWVFDGFKRLNRSTDGGENWSLTGFGFGVSSFDAASEMTDGPGSVGTLYLATYASGILVSHDSGASFHPINTGLPSNVPMGRIVVDPDDPQRLIAGVGPTVTFDPLHPATLYLSTDGGANWNGVLALGDGTPYYGQAPDVSFGAGSRVYASISGALYRSDDRGATWEELPLSAYELRADPTVADHLVFTTHDGVARSTDGGFTSMPLNSGLDVIAGQVPAPGSLVTHPSWPAVPQLWLGTTGGGVYFSGNGGTTWTPRSEGLSSVQIRALAMFHDAATHRLFAGYGDMFSPSPALFRGNNAGPGQPFTSWAPSNTNLEAFQIRSLVIDPTTRAAGIGGTRIYASGRGPVEWDNPLRNGGIYRSLDGGGTWSTIDAGLPTSGDPPAPEVGTVRSLVLDPRSCAAPPPSGPCTAGPLLTLYATANGRSTGGTASFRVIKSVDGGTNWASRDAGIPQPLNAGTPESQSLLVVPIVVNPLNPQELYVGTSAIFDSTALPIPTIRSGVFKSSDGGASWIHRSNGLPRFEGSLDTAHDVLSLAINPANPQELWCSVTPMDGLTSGGIFHTVDGGATWTDASTGLSSIDIRALHVDPTEPSTLYASGGGTAGNPGGIFKSTDSGASWRSISIGLPADAALALEVDPVDPRVLHAGTSSGVWSLMQLPDADGDGVPDEVENAAPNSGDGNDNGIPDALEPNAGSLTSAAPGGTTGEGAFSAGDWFTVTVEPVTGACVQAVDVQSVYAAYHGTDVSDYGDAYAYPRQLARFEITDCEEAKVTLKFHQATFGAGTAFRFFGPAVPGDPASIGWHAFDARATQVAPDTWELVLTNGAFGSWRPASARSILFEGGPGWKEGIFRDGFQ